MITVAGGRYEPFWRSRYRIDVAVPQLQAVAWRAGRLGVEISTTEWNAAGRQLVAAAGSVVGTRYDENYDVLYVDPQRPLAVVADGMGDGPASSTAGRTAVDTFVRHTGTVGGPSTLRSAVAEVQRAVRAAGRRSPDLTGCTLTAFVGDSADADTAWLVQLGDSRAYRLRDGLLELLTADHTAAWLGVLNGWYTPQSPQGRSAGRRLTRYAGHPQSPEPDVLNVNLRPGDRILLCTDGVYDEVDDQDMTEALGGTSDPARSIATLLGESADRDDNATAVLIHVMEVRPFIIMPSRQSRTHGSRQFRAAELHVTDGQPGGKHARSAA